MTISIYEARSERQKQRVFEFRYQIHFVELGKVSPSLNHELRQMTDECDEGATILYAEDENGNIVGTATTIFGSKTTFPEQIIERFDLAVLENKISPEKLSVTGRLMVDPSYRGRTLTSLLVTRLYQLAIEHGTEFDFCMCSLPLLRLYQRLGYQTYQERTIRPDGVNLRVPLVLSVRDKQHLQKTKSPFLRILKSDSGRCTMPSDFIQQAYGSEPVVVPGLRVESRILWAQFADALTRSEHARPNLFTGMSDSQREILLARSTVHRFAPGELVKLRNERRKGLGVILEGQLGVGIPLKEDHHWVEILKAGDVFGEVSLPPKDGRAVDLVSQEACSVVLLPDDIVERLEKSNPKLAMLLARNLVSVLRQRVDDMHRMTAEKIQTSRNSFAPAAYR